MVRADLPNGLQAAQAVHAAFEFSQQHWDLCAPWLRDSNYLVIVSVPDEYSLMGVIEQANKLGIKFTAVREPDIDDELTAVTLQPGAIAKKLCASLPLAMKEVALT